MPVLMTCKFDKDPINNERASVDTSFSHYTLNESYNLPPYILAASSDNKSKASTKFSFIQRVNSCQISSSNFISKGSLLLEQAQSE